jgi:hypothetical protein
MSMARPERPRVDPDPEALAEARGQRTAHVTATIGLHPELRQSFLTRGDAVLTEASTPRRHRELVILRMGGTAARSTNSGSTRCSAGKRAAPKPRSSRSPGP